MNMSIAMPVLAAAVACSLAATAAEQRLTAADGGLTCCRGNNGLFLSRGKTSTW